MKTHDTTVQELVMDELRWDPTVDAATVGVAAHNGAITLSGHVPSYWQFVAAEKAAKRVRGVVAVANELEVHRQSEGRAAAADGCGGSPTARR
jgi:osmotically-inducible protein OsmY